MDMEFLPQATFNLKETLKMISHTATVLLNGMMVASFVERFVKVNFLKEYTCGAPEIYTQENFLQMDNAGVKVFY
jgi:hypothetical protein